MQAADGSLVFEPFLLEHSARTYAGLGWSAARVRRLANEARAEGLCDTAEYIRQVARTMRAEERKRAYERRQQSLAGPRLPAFRPSADDGA